jgi:hypothetical protein
MKRVQGCVWGILLGWRTMLYTEIAVFAFVFLLGQMFGWTDIAKYSEAMIYVGVAMIVFGAYSLMGGYNSTRGSMYMYASSASGESMNSIMDKGARYNYESYSCFTLAGLLGLLTIGVSLIFLAIFG